MQYVSWKPTLFVLFLLFVVFIGCSDEDADGSGCSKDTDCREGRICENGTCVFYTADSDSTAQDGDTDSDGSQQTVGDEDPTDSDESQQVDGDNDQEQEWDWSEIGIPIFTPSPQPEGVCARRVLRYQDAQCNNTTRSQCEVKEYDAAGNVIYTHEDPDCNGSTIKCTHAAFDEQGRQILTASDTNCDGKTNECQITLYDENGYPKEQRNCASEPWNTGEVHDTDCLYRVFDDDRNTLYGYKDEDCNGSPDSNCHWQEYDALNNKRAFIQDTDCNGKCDYATVYTYDGQGNVLTKSSGCKEATDCYAYEYNTSGNKIRQRLDQDCDGFDWEYCYTYEYDSNGRIIQMENDRLCDGTVIECESYGYTDFPYIFGNSDYCFAGVSKSLRIYYDLTITKRHGNNDCSLGISSCLYASFYNEQAYGPYCPLIFSNYGVFFVYQYSEDGTILTLGLDTDCEGLSEEECEVNFIQDEKCGTFYVNEDGTAELISCDEDCNGTPDTYEEIRDDTGRPLSSRSDPTGQANWIECKTYTYDNEGNLQTIEEDEDCDGTPNLCIREEVLPCE